MKRYSSRNALWGFVLVLVAMSIIGCGGDDDNDNPTVPATRVDLTGTWEISGPGLGLNVLYLTQDASGAISGTVDRAVTDGGWDRGVVAFGSNLNNNLTISILYDDLMTVELTGKATSQNNIGGTYKSYYDPASVSQDAWSGTRRTS